MHKVITFGIPSYNAAKDMDHCITSILEGSNYATDIEIIVLSHRCAARVESAYAGTHVLRG